MRYSITLLLAVFVFLVSQRVQAQQVIMSSSLMRDVTTGEMVGFSRTEMDFNTQAWYQAYVSNEIRRQSDNFLLVSGEDFSAPGTDRLASKTIRTAGFPNTTYRLDSKHWILPLLNSWCTFSRLDRYQFTATGPPFIGGNYGATQTFFGFDGGSGSGVCVPGWIYLGQTTQSKTVPSVTITNPRIGSVPAQSTQTALLGADVVLSSNVTPAGGSYAWTFTGPFSVSSGGSSSPSLTIRSSDLGTITARLTYTLNGIVQSQQFTINVVVPSLQSFTAQQGPDLIAAPTQCDPDVPFWFYKLGCGGSNPGISFTASVQVSPFMSDPTQSGIKMVQAVSTHRKQMIAGNLRCSTRRSDPSDVASGWQLDGSNPYQNSEVHRFSEGNTLTTRGDDTPGHGLTFITPLEFVDAVQIDDRFEMYVVYFTFDAANPPISRTLGKLEWNWGGLVVFDNPGIHKIRSTLVTPGPKSGQAATSMVNMQGTVQSTGWQQCPDAPPRTTHPIDATRYFVRQHYLDFLAREPDLDGWNHWTSEITKCAFDFNCIYFERNHIGHAFLLVANSVVQDPAMANPPGTPGFNAAAYNRAFVRHCYLNYLRREPDPAGWDHWTNELNSDGNYGHILDAFQQSPEYRRRICPTC